MKKRFALFALCAAMVMSAVCAEAVTKLKLGNKMNAAHPESVAIQRACDNIKARTNGEVEIQCYFGEVLGDSKKQLDNMVRGVQHFYVDGYGFYAA